MFKSTTCTKRAEAFRGAVLDSSGAYQTVRYLPLQRPPPLSYSPMCLASNDQILIFISDLYSIHITHGTVRHIPGFSPGKVAFAFQQQKLLDDENRAETAKLGDQEGFRVCHVDNSRLPGPLLYSIQGGGI